MDDLVTDIPEQIDQLIKRGYSVFLLEKIQSVLSSNEISVEKELTYQLLKCRSLTGINHHNQALKLLNEIENEIFEIGSDVQKMDFYFCKAANFEVLSRNKEALNLLEKVEQIIRESSLKDTPEILQKKIDLFIQRMIIKTITKRHFEFYQPEKSEEILDSFNQCLELSYKLNYDYGIGLSLEHKGFYLFYERKNTEALEYYKEAYEVWKKTDNKYGQASILFREGMVHAFTGNHNLAIGCFEKAFIISKEIKNKRLIASTHFGLDIAHSNKGDSKIALEHSKIACDMFREIGDKILSAISLQNYATGIIYGELDYEKGLSLLYEALSYAKEAQSRRTINTAYMSISSAFLFKGELNRALDFLDESIEYFETEADYEGLVFSLSQKGYINRKKGDLVKALQNYQESLELHKLREFPIGVRSSFINIGIIFQMKGEFKEALQYFYKAKEISESLKNNLSLASDYFYLSSCYLEIGNLEKASSYMQSLQEIEKTNDYKVLSIITNLTKALVLKRSENEPDKIEAKKLLKSIINEEDVQYQIMETAILNLCELLLVELKKSEEELAIKELKFYVEKLQEVGFRELTYPLLVQTYWLQSQISLLELNTEEAQLLYTKAQTIAEEKELEYMAMKISAEHDFLIGQLDLWKQFTKKLPSILEILELTRIEDMLNQMLRRGVVLPSNVEHEEEDPALIFILSESGEILFTEKISETIAEELITRILPEIRTRIDEESGFEIIKRGKLYDYSYIIKSVDSLFFCYFFVGKSYQAIKRLEEFSRILTETSAIWNQLITSSKSDLTLSFEERRSITSFIDDIFLTSR